MSLTVVIPSRGRPERARAAVQAVRDTAVLVDTSVVLAVDADDPALREYKALHFRPFGAEVNVVTLSGDDTGNLVRATNTLSRRIAEVDPTGIIGNLGDDHICRTPGWDRRVTEVLRHPGIAYGDDLLQGALLPTAPFVSAAIVNELGWYFLPVLTHMYVDDALKAIGTMGGCLHYLPDVVIEHLHPGAGKVEMDPGYERADASTEADRKAFERWLVSDEAGRIMARVESLVAVAA